MNTSLPKHTRNASHTCDQPPDLPPHDSIAEACLLGALILSPSSIEQARESIQAEAFFDPQHQAVWQALCQLSDAHAPIASDTVAAALRDAGEADAFGIVSRLIDNPPEAPSIEFHRGRVVDSWKRRVAFQTAAELAIAARDQTRPIDLELCAAADAIRWQAGNGRLPNFEDIGTLADEQLPTPPALIEGLLRQGEKAVLGGASKTFKSWLCLDMAVCVSHGISWLGRGVSPGVVLLANLELPRWCIRKRILDVASARGVRLESGRLLVWNLRGQVVSAAQLRAEIARRNIADLRLVIIDPAYKLLLGRDENSAGDIANLLGHLEGITKDTGASVLLPTHFAKGNASGKESQDRISGSGVFARDPDSIFTLTRHEEDNAFTFEATLRTFAPAAPFVLRWQHPVFSVDEGLDPARLKKPARGPSARYTPEKLVKILPPDGLPRPAWCKRAQSKFGISKSTFYAVASQCEDQGFIVVDDSDLCTPTKTVSTPYKD